MCECLTKVWSMYGTKMIVKCPRQRRLLQNLLQSTEESECIVQTQCNEKRSRMRQSSKGQSQY